MYINKVTIKNFKRIKDETYEFTDFDLLVGCNNSGKSTILQAMAIWQYCVDEFHRSERKGSRGIQIVLPNFTALPLPEFNLMWTDKSERSYSGKKGQKKPKYIYIEIIIGWLNSINNKEPQKEFGVQIRYQSPQSVYAIPLDGWKLFKELDSANELPHIVYVPPFSGLETSEPWRDDGIIRKNIGKAQPGSVLRNLLYRVIDKTTKDKNGESIVTPIKENVEWQKIVRNIENWFGVTLNAPEYEKGVSTEIKVTYKKEKNKEFDIIAGGSGFHQVLTLLAFIYGWQKITTILFDEPDAHLHVNLQRKILEYLQQTKNFQFLIATHAEELIKGVNANSIISVLSPSPKRIQSSAPIITALSDIDNMTIVATMSSPFILYVEGEDDYRLLTIWAGILGKRDILAMYHIHYMHGGNKQEMKTNAENHFNGLRVINFDVQRIMLFDYDSDAAALNLGDDNPVIYEWKRKNIENYLLVPGPWKRALLKKQNLPTEELINKSSKKGIEDLFVKSSIDIIDDFFTSQNISRPPKSTWENVIANIFQVIDGKKILFENADSLFQLIKKEFKLLINRESVANEMLAEEIHIDIKKFFEKLEKLTLMKK